MSVLVCQCSQHSFSLCHRLIGIILMTYSLLSPVFFSNELFFCVLQIYLLFCLLVVNFVVVCFILFKKKKNFPCSWDYGTM